MTLPLAQFVLDNGRAVIARWDKHRAEVVYEQERKRPAGDRDAQPLNPDLASAGRS